MSKLFKVTDIQSMDGQGIENVYWYSTTQNNTTSLQVATAFNQQVVAPLRTLQSAVLNHVSLKVDEVLGGSDSINAAQTGSTSGTKGGDYLPVFNTFGFSLPPASGLFRQGGKRYAGIVEADTNSGLLLTAFKTALGVFSLQVTANIVIPAISATLVPVIVRPLGNPVVNYLVTQIIGAVVSELSTQNSRKKYHGGGELSFGDGINFVNYNDESEVSGFDDGTGYAYVESTTSQDKFEIFKYAQLSVTPMDPTIL